MSSDVKVLETIVVIALLFNDDDDDDDDDDDEDDEEEKENLPCMSRRETDGGFHTIFQELKQEDAEGFREKIQI